MNLEDEMISELESRDRAIAVWQQKEEKTRGELAEERRQKEEALKQVEAAIEALVALGKSRAEAKKLLGIE